MSGKKSSDVNQLLSKAELARKAGDACFENNFCQAMNRIKQLQNEMEQIADQLETTKYIIKEETRQELTEECESLEESRRTLSQSIRELCRTGDMSGYDNKRKQLEQRLKKADRETEEIRETIRHKSWYLDDEFRKADELVGVYQQISEEKNNLLHAINGEVQNCTLAAKACQRKEENLKLLEERGIELNQKAEKIQSIRQEASKARAFIENEISKIDDSTAQKFMSSQYDHLKETWKEISHIGDQEIVPYIKDFSQSISEFSMELSEKLSEYHQKKDKAEGTLGELERLLSVNTTFYYDAQDYTGNGDKAEKISLLDYLDKYGHDEKITDAICDGIDQIKECIEQEQFETAVIRSEQNRKMIQEAMQYAEKIQNNRITDLNNAYTLYDVLNEMGYRPKAKKIGKDSDKDGWRIEGRTMAGDVFNVDRIFTDDAGNTHIQVNEQVEGTCQNATKEFSQKAAKKGLIFERFTMENGTVVADRTERKTAQKSAVNSQIIGRVRM